METQLRRLPELRDVTIGPDGTMIGRSPGGMRFIKPLDLHWIETAWSSGLHGVVARLALAQDGLDGRQGSAPADLNYLPAIRASSREARTRMLDIAESYVSAPVMAEHLGLTVDVLSQIVAEAYGLRLRHR